VKNPNTPINRAADSFKGRWFGPDYPGGEPRFQIAPFAKDVGLFILLPAVCVLLGKSWTDGPSPRKVRSSPAVVAAGEAPAIKPQILSFSQSRPVGQATISAARRAPGTLVKVRLLNAVEALSEAPVHVQIVDAALGSSFYGGTLLGDGSADSNFSRMNINFRFARRNGDERSAIPIAARALSLDGVLGVEAAKKEGAFARGVLSGASAAASGFGNKGQESQSLQSILLQALTQGLAGEFSGEANVARNQASVLTLEPGLEFFAELRDYFPAGGR
jgi:hypothetical protein